MGKVCFHCAFSPWQNQCYIKTFSTGLYQKARPAVEETVWATTFAILPDKWANQARKPGQLSQGHMYKTSPRPLPWGYLKSYGIWEVEIKIYDSTQTHPLFFHSCSPIMIKSIRNRWPDIKGHGFLPFSKCYDSWSGSRKGITNDESHRVASYFKYSDMLTKCMV